MPDSTSSSQNEEYSQQDLQDMLPIYYKRLFPHKPFKQWLTYYGSKYRLLFAHVTTVLIPFYHRREYDIYPSRVFIHVDGRCLHSIFIVRNRCRIGGRHLLEESVQNRYWACDVWSTEEPSFNLIGGRSKRINFRY